MNDAEKDNLLARGKLLPVTSSVTDRQTHLLTDKSKISIMIYEYNIMYSKTKV